MDVASTIIDWHSRAKMHSYGHTLIGILPAFICWHIWRERCNRRFSSQTHCWPQIVLVIIADCNFMLAGKKYNFLGGDAVSLNQVGFKIPLVLEKLYLIVRWSPPLFGLKENVDGSASSFSAGGGGIVRDDYGRVVIAFSN